MDHMAHALYEVIAIGAVSTLTDVEDYMSCRCVTHSEGSAVWTWTNQQ